MVELIVAIPSSILEVEHGLLLKTLKIHQVIRYSTIYGVQRLIVYRDPYTEQVKHVEYVKLFNKISKYLKTPPYLRKKIVPLDNDLRYIGAVPPLRLEIFNVSRKGVIGEKRLGYMMDRGFIDIGLDRYFRVENPRNCYSIFDRLAYVRIESIDPPIVKCIEEKPYTGPEIVFLEGFKTTLEYIRKVDPRVIIIATSRYGKTPSIKDLERVSSEEYIALLFGSPHYGLYDIAGEEGLDLETVVDYVWNTIPYQRVKTVRTEEALISTLAIINIFVNR